jgi:hypothetical protein
MAPPARWKKPGERRRDRRNAASGVCDCYKAQYLTVRVANRAVAEAEARGEGRHRVYRCPRRSRTWHITHWAGRAVSGESEIT